MSEKLWEEYRRAWDAFAKDSARLQKLRESGQPDGMNFVSDQVEDSRCRYNAARDRLARTFADREIFDERRIRTVARLLWEFSGQPENTAESDWRRAEALARSASA